MHDSESAPSLRPLRLCVQLSSLFIPTATYRVRPGPQKHRATSQSVAVSSVSVCQLLAVSFPYFEAFSELCDPPIFFSIFL